jgi:hypothetical protein
MCKANDVDKTGIEIIIGILNILYAKTKDIIIEIISGKTENMQRGISL